ncbi:hypothetical protein GCM10017714_33530 [Curtobacterium pusillum]|uniref:Nuclear transport factor 2 family protein n=1 Tax=Curtobacterium pusillum TaxID=69373 RepID=A0ABX2M5F4_9MICO|nr:hypothetical protein [Curtobacterium pusillum]NUU12723.1 hypothetical protein [Curtobacterium pusillum]GLK31613.1 hypothetical protein GCM10017610_18980 [Curtobacterium pusillum]
MTIKTPKPVVTEFTDGGVIVTKTHDPEAARDALLAYFESLCGNDDALVEECLTPYLDYTPVLETGRWLRRGNDELSYWTPGGGRGATRAVVWYA